MLPKEKVSEPTLAPVPEPLAPVPEPLAPPPTLQDKIRKVSAERQFDIGLELILLEIADELDKLRR